MMEQGDIISEADVHREDEAEDNQSVSVVNMNFKLPEFYPSNPRMWLAKVEALFHTKKVISQADKYFAAFAVLPYSVVRLLPAVRDGIPRIKPFDVLRESILEEFTPSVYQRMEALANLPPLGDQKPSQLLATIRDLETEGNQDSDFGRFAWLSRLPENIRAQLVHLDDLDMNRLAKTADKIHKSYAGINNINSYESEEDESSVNAVRSSNYSSRNNKPNQRPAQPSQLRSPQPNLCWYHTEYGASAHNCKDTRSGPCSWKPTQGNGKGRRRN